MKIPVVLVTGFLGSGKTTFLRRLALDYPDWRLVFLVNEYAQTSVDGETLAATGTPTQSVVGGSLFCECKASEFVNVMRGTVLQAHREAALDAVIIETSGIADPEAIGTIMRDFALEEDFEIAQVVTIVAPKRFLTLVENLPIITAQIQASDLVVINKTDLASEEEIEITRHSIDELQPQAQIVQSAHCAFPFSLTNRRSTLPAAALATCEANPFDTREVDFTGRVTLAALNHWLHRRDPSIVRVKGHVRTDTGWHRIEATVDSVEVTAVEASATSQLVLIAHEDDEVRLDEAVRQLHQLEGRP